MKRAAILGPIVLIVLLSPVTKILAAGGPHKPPTLREVIESAFTRHPQQQALAAQASEVDALAARADSLIAASPSLEAGYRTDQIGSNDGYREWEAGVSLPLWKRGLRRAEKEVAQGAATTLERDTRAVLLEVAGEVRERMWDAVLMKNNEELAKKEWDTAVDLQKSIARRVELGELARSDLLLARDAALSKEGDYLRAQKEFRNALQRYQAYTGTDRLPRRRGEPLAPVTIVPDDHPQLAAAQAAVREAQLRAAVARRQGGGVPEVFLGGSGERDDSDADFDSRLGVSVSVPLGMPAHTRPAVASAERLRAEAQTDYETLHRRLELALSEAAQEVTSAQAELGLAQKQNELARESAGMARIAFEAGESNLLDLLRVQALAFAAERREKELRITRQRAVARYNQAMGVLP